MSINPSIRRKVQAFEDAGYDCSPHPQDSMICPCGYEGRPAYVIPFDEVDEVPGDVSMFVCPECGDG